MDLVGRVMVPLHRAFEMGDEGRAFDGEVVVVLHDSLSFFLFVELLYPSSLRAQRSNPDYFRGDNLDCFASLAMTAAVRCSRRAHRHPARLPSSSPTGSDAGIPCASALLPCSPNSWRPHSPGSAR